MKIRDWKFVKIPKMRRTLLMRPSKASTKMEDPKQRHFKRCYSTFLWLLIMIGCMRVSWCAAGVWADIASITTSLFQRSTRILLTTLSAKKLSCQSASQEEAKLPVCFTVWVWALSVVCWYLLSHRKHQQNFTHTNINTPLWR